MTRKELRTRIRNKIHDFPLNDTLKAECTASADTIQVNHSTYYNVGTVLLIGTERMNVLSISGDTLTIVRGYKETTAAIHLISAAITIESFFSDDYINQEITNAFQAIYPQIYNTIRDVSLSITELYAYDLSALATAINEITGLSLVEIEDESYDDKFWKKTDWLREGTQLEFLSLPSYTGRRIRLTYAVPYTAPTDDTTALTLPDRYTEIIEFYVLGRLDESRMELRSHFEEYSAKDATAASLGDLMGISGYNIYQFNLLLERLAMPPLSFNIHRRIG